MENLSVTTRALCSETMEAEGSSFRALSVKIRATAGIVAIDAETGRGRKRGSLLDARSPCI